MWPDLLRRVRWGNATLALAILVAAGALIGALTGAPPPRLPPNETVPLFREQPRAQLATPPPERGADESPAGEQPRGAEQRRVGEQPRGADQRRVGEQPRGADQRRV